MTHRKRFVQLSVPGVILIIVSLFGCAQLSSIIDQAPTADFTATPSTNITTGTQVTLNAQNSSDPQGYTLAYSWTLIGPSRYRRNCWAMLAKTGRISEDEEGRFERSEN